MHLRLIVLVGLALALACDRSQRGDPALAGATTSAAPAPAAPTVEVSLQLLASAFTSLTEHGAKSPKVPAEHALGYAREVVRFDAQRTKVFLAVGRSAKAYEVAEPDEACLTEGTCFSMYIASLSAQEKAEFDTITPAELAAQEASAVALAKILADGTLETEIIARMDRAKAKILGLTGLAWDGPPSGKKVWLLSLGSAAEARRDAALARVRAAHPEAAQVAVVTKAAHPEVFALLGERVSAGVVVGDELVQSITEDAQWLELLLGERAVLSPVPRTPNLPLVDAHSHIAEGGEVPLLAALDRNGIRYAVIAALPRDRSYAGLREANDRVLSVAKAHPGRFVPLVMVSPLDPDPLPQFERDVAAGARGVKLMNGHGDYFSAGGVPVLDPPGLRKIFAYCEKRGLPILWHVNTHLYSKGFLRVLKDFPRLKVVNPHLGGYLSYAPKLMRQLLETYPNLYFDVSFGVNVAYLRRSLDDLSAKHVAWRALMTDHADRFLFGVDLVVSPRTAGSHADMIYASYLGMLTAQTYDFAFFPATGNAKLYEDVHQRYGLLGLALPEAVLRKIFADNAIRIYGVPATAPAKAK